MASSWCSSAPPGCGKSTALRSIAGLEEITGGTISIGGRVVNDLPPKDRDIAMVFQNYALYPHMTVEQNLAFGLQQRKTPKEEIRRRVSEVARMLGLEQYLKRKPAALSGGQRQRVAMGRAIVREPQAFLMDEPLSNLDAKLRVSMRASLTQLHERLGVTTVYVTHDQVEAMTLGHRVCVLRDGQLQQVDTPQTLFDRPVNLFVAGFIGSPAMNFVTAAPGPRRRARGRPSPGHRLPLPAGLVDSRPAWTATSAARSSSASARPTSRTPPSPTRPGRGCSVTADVTEELGSEIHVLFTIDAAAGPPPQHQRHRRRRRRRRRGRRRWPAASRCGPPGSPPAARSARASPSSSPSTPRTCSSSTPTSGLSIGRPAAAAG